MPGSPKLSSEPAASQRRGLRVSLELRVLSLVAVINLVVFGAGLWHLSTKFDEERSRAQQEVVERVLYTLKSSISPTGELRVAQILSWPYWNVFTDAVISDLNPHGVTLNPVGSAGRGIEFDSDLIQSEMRSAVNSGGDVLVAGGRALAIADARGRTWGGVWFRVADAEGALPLWRGLLPWFFASTLLLYGGTFGVLRRYVLQPVGALASAAQRVRGGDLGVEVDLPAHRDELADLMANFNHMSREVKDFHDHLEVQIDQATRAAFEAESAALRQRRLAAMGELAAGIAHEINNPLGGMINAVETLDRGKLEPDQTRRYLQLVRGGLERIQNTVASLLRFTPRASERVAVDLAGPVADAIELMGHAASRSGVEIRFENHAPGVCVMGSTSEFGQAILNLLSNALHAIEDRGSSGGLVEVQLARLGDELRLRVLDDGCGVPAGELEAMTDLFHTTKEVGRGTGLGLALVLSVVNEYGGRVHFKNRPEGGFCVDMILAVADLDGAGS